ncbi:Asp/Glu racemase [Streptomonospora algeriensis]|uniref:Asp/Glu racemase n=1 Tax=Streptomonospora algeriensis TaxID=995084 RepID=A0ABW3BG67_9ACTN
MRTDRTAGEPVDSGDQEERVLLKHPETASDPAEDAPAASADVVELSALAETPRQSGVGIVAPYDFALDRELWRWAPDDVSLYVTRLPFVPVPVTVDQASALCNGDDVARATRDLLAPEPLVVGYACASGSFVHGADGQDRLRQSILDAGAPAAVTTSGALIQALEALAVRRIAVVTPYVDSVTDRLLDYLADHGVESTSSVGLGLLGHIWKTTYSEVVQAVRDADRPDAEAVFISCTNVLTYDIIAPLERMLGKPVIAANQVTMWAAMQAMGRRPVAHSQHLVDATARSTAA